MLATRAVHRPEPVERRSPSERRPARARRAQARALARYACGLSLAVVAALAVAASSARVARLGQDLVVLKEELRLLEADNQRLEAEILGLQSLARIEREAKRLGLREPPAVRPVPFALAPAGQPAAALARGGPASGAARQGGTVQAGALSGPGLRSAVAALDRLAERVARWLAGS